MWRRCGVLPARAFRLGMLGFDRFILAPLGLPLGRLPAPDFAEALGVLAIKLVLAPGQVLLSTAFAQANPSPQ